MVSNASRKVSNRLQIEGETSGSGVAAELEQVFPTGGQAGKEVEGRDGAGRTTSQTIFLSEQGHGSMITFRQLGGDDADDTGMPVAGRENQGGPVV